MLYLSFLIISLLLFVFFLVRLLRREKSEHSKDHTYYLLPLNIITMLVIIISAFTQWAERRDFDNQMKRYEVGNYQRIVDDFQSEKQKNKEIWEKYANGKGGLDDNRRHDRLGYAFLYGVCSYPLTYSQKLKAMCDDLKKIIEELNVSISTFKYKNEAQRNEEQGKALHAKIRANGNEMLRLYESVEEGKDNVYEK